MTPLVVSYGGGVNSVAMLVGYQERGIRPDAIVFSDTKGEKPETYYHQRVVMRGWLGTVGFPELTVVARPDFGRSKTGDDSLEAECLRLGSLPSRAYGYGRCADKWKLDPFKWWAQTWAPALAAWDNGAVVRRALGYDAGEARRVNDRQDAGFEKTYPLVEWGWDRTACVAAVRRAGLPVPVKSACFYCPSSTKSEVLALASVSPLLFQRAVALETRAAEAMPDSVVVGLGRRFSWAGLAAADQAQLDLWPESLVEACMVCEAGE